MDIRINLNRSPYGRRVLSGVYEAVRYKPDCMLWLHDPNLPQAPPNSFDGIIGVPQAARTGPILGPVPIININSVPVEGTWQVYSDNYAICKMAFDHLYDRQIRQFCYVHVASGGVSRARLVHLGELAEAAGCPWTIIKAEERGDLHETDLIANALRNLPLPVGIMLPRDRFAPPVFDACNELGLKIPDDVAVISINNALPLCTSTVPPLTSIELNAEAVGVQALELVTRLADGEDIPKDPIVVPPRQLVARESTDRKHRRDESVVKAIDYMMANISEPVVLEDLLRQQPLSQRVFERRFKEETGMPPMRYLRHLRLERAKNLLETTDLKVIEIAERCGIPDSNHLCALFRQHIKVTPLAYRRSASS